MSSEKVTAPRRAGGRDPASEDHTTQRCCGRMCYLPIEPAALPVALRCFHLQDALESECAGCQDLRLVRKQAEGLTKKDSNKKSTLSSKIAYVIRKHSLFGTRFAQHKTALVACMNSGTITQMVMNMKYLEDGLRYSRTEMT